MAHFRKNLVSLVLPCFLATAWVACFNDPGTDNNGNTDTPTDTGTTGDGDGDGDTDGTDTGMTDTGTTGDGDGDGDMDMGTPDPCDQTEAFSNAAFLIALIDGLDQSKLNGYTDPPQGEEPFLLDFPLQHAARDAVSKSVWRKILDVDDMDDPKHDDYPMGLDPDEMANVCWVDYLEGKAGNLPDFHKVLANGTSGGGTNPGDFWVTSGTYHVYGTSEGMPLTEVVVVNDLGGEFASGMAELAVDAVLIICEGMGVVGMPINPEPLSNQGEATFMDVACHHTMDGPVEVTIDFRVADLGVDNDMIIGHQISLGMKAAPIPLLGWGEEVIPTFTVE